jgi:hypothetical protein
MTLIAPTPFGGFVDLRPRLDRAQFRALLLPLVGWRKEPELDQQRLDRVIEGYRHAPNVHLLGFEQSGIPGGRAFPVPTRVELSASPARPPKAACRSDALWPHRKENGGPRRGARRPSTQKSGPPWEWPPAAGFSSFGFHDDRPFAARVGDDLAQGFFDGAANDAHARRLLLTHLQLVEGALSAEQREPMDSPARCAPPALVR